eukprot:TRINITY_DN2529_c0_g1_i6.p1 TRINITY_DN2529_c0_g1~~TRINITY_DN2529_c0_g1_i6.p1  ORF type:complete len:380 (-),score=42.08 TRINITY_DN2529_c0_g1_i6:196-1335(-)
MSRLCGLNFKENLGDQLFEVLSRRKRSTSASDFIGEAPSKELETSRPIADPGIGLTIGGGAAGSTNDSLASGTSRRSRRRIWRSQHSSAELQDDPVSTSLPPGRGSRIGAGQPRELRRVEPHQTPMVADRAENASSSVPLPRAAAQSRRAGQQDSRKPPGTFIPSVSPGIFYVQRQSPGTLDQLPSNADVNSVFQQQVKGNGAQYDVHLRNCGCVGPRNVSFSELLCGKNTNNDAASSAALGVCVCVCGVCGTHAEERVLSRTKEDSTSDHMKFRLEEGAYGEVRLYLKAYDLLRSSSASLRDAEVSFTDQGLRARIIDSGGGCRCIRTTQWPGDIDSDRCTYKVGKDGRDLILQLMKKDTSEQWTSQDIRFACVGDAE